MMCVPKKIPIKIRAKGWWGLHTHLDVLREGGQERPRGRNKVGTFEGQQVAQHGWSPLQGRVRADQVGEAGRGQVMLGLQTHNEGLGYSAKQEHICRALSKANNANALKRAPWHVV